MLQARYSSWTGRKLEIHSPYHAPFEVEFRGWRNTVQWQIGANFYSLENPKGKGYPITITINGQELMRIERFGFWKPILEGHYANQPLRFERPSAWKSTYQVYLNYQIVGEVKTEGFWNRAMIANFHDSQPFDLQLGCLLFAITTWRREAASAAAAS
ncbi:hypothetical protein [Herpetosiphon geysericola]|uniref:Uncharacterized protein n=1 Tax=Herpetosiphon geysericola TaxID=70996 RepID=A0A0P6YLW2_9CHLR|nr:hypothetical protein [Herpetosiphon geysericola]KPL83678.1 hypothetical protein SE18_19065 [Herpetosiphon geysericola]